LRLGGPAISLGDGPPGVVPWGSFLIPAEVVPGPLAAPWTQAVPRHRPARDGPSRRAPVRAGQHRGFPTAAGAKLPLPVPAVDSRSRLWSHLRSRLKSRSWSRLWSRLWSHRTMSGTARRHDAEQGDQGYRRKLPERRLLPHSALSAERQPTPYGTGFTYRAAAGGRAIPKSAVVPSYPCPYVPRSPSIQRDKGRG
jgi:hypothetical protein